MKATQVVVCDSAVEEALPVVVVAAGAVVAAVPVDDVPVTGAVVDMAGLAPPLLFVTTSLPAVLEPV